MTEPAPPPRDAPRIPPPLYFAAALALGLLAERARPFPFPAAMGSPARLAIGWTLVALSSLAVLAAIRGFRRAGTTILPYRRPSAFVAAGPYRYTRNPMYVGLAGTSVGIAVLLGSLWAIGGVALAIAAVDRLVIRGEEARLEAAFGEEYLAYKRQVRRWL